MRENDVLTLWREQLKDLRLHFLEMGKDYGSGKYEKEHICESADI